MQVFFVNGNPRAGKDSFVDLVCGELRPFAPSTSWIDPVKGVIHDLDIDVGAKTEADRLLLAEIGDSLERHNAYLSRRCVQFAMRRHGPDRVVFIFARQQVHMRTMEQLLRDADPSIEVFRLLVQRPGAGEINSNQADAGVNHIAYDIVIHNDADLEALELVAAHFAGLCRDKRVRRQAVSPFRATLVLHASRFTPITKEKAA